MKIENTKTCQSLVNTDLNSKAVSIDTPFSTIISVLENFAYQNSKGIELAEKIENKGYCRIDSYEKPLKLKAVIDYLDLNFEIDITKFSGTNIPIRSQIKKYLTIQTGIKYYITSEKNHTFTIRIHDVKNKKIVKKITNLLHIKYNSPYEKMTISRIELCHDFYNVEHKGLLLALVKSIRFAQSTNNYRLYKSKNEVQLKIPSSVCNFMGYINKGYTIGVNHRDHSDVQYRFYYKITDKKQPIHDKSKHRIRAEVCINKRALVKNGLNCNFENLKEIINYGLGLLTYTQPKNNFYTYQEATQLFGKEQPKRSNTSHRIRLLNNDIETNSKLNNCARNANKNLIRNFI